MVDLGFVVGMFGEFVVCCDFVGLVFGFGVEVELVDCGCVDVVELDLGVVDYDGIVGVDFCGVGDVGCFGEFG